MSTIFMESLATKVVGFLRLQISDPISRGAEFVYYDYPRLDTQMPRISVLQIGSRERERGVGDHGTIWEIRYDIDVWCDSKTKATINSTKYSGSKLREYLADQVIKSILDNRPTLLSNYDIIGATVGTIFTHPYDEEIDSYRKTIPITITVIRTKV